MSISKKILLTSLGSILFLAGCQDKSKNKHDIDAVSKTKVTQETISTGDETGDQYHAEGLTRYDDEPPKTSIDDVEEAPQIPEKAPIQIKLKLNSVYAEYGLGKIEVQATTDQVIINQIIVNRGQCSAIDNSIPMPVTLSFGRTYTGYINNCALDKIIEVQINTNLGSWKFET
jgi:hypothetical protein